MRAICMTAGSHHPIRARSTIRCGHRGQDDEAGCRMRRHSLSRITKCDLCRHRRCMHRSGVELCRPRSGLTWGRVARSDVRTSLSGTNWPVSSQAGTAEPVVATGARFPLHFLPAFSGTNRNSPHRTGTSRNVGGPLAEAPRTTTDNDHRHARKVLSTRALASNRSDAGDRFHNRNTPVIHRLQTLRRVARPTGFERRVPQDSSNSRQRDMYFDCPLLLQPPKYRVLVNCSG